MPPPEDVNNPNHGDQEEPIRLTAYDCNELFDECLAQSGDSQGRHYSRIVPFVKEYRRRFDAWSSFLGVFATRSNARLDYRVRCHPALQDMLIRLLEMLRENLLLLNSYCGRSLHTVPYS